LGYAEKKSLQMPILVDEGSRAARQFGLVYTVPEDLRQVYLGAGLDVAGNNADGSWDLPMTARYIIDTDGKIRYAHVSPDYTIRPDPEHTMDALRGLK